jgi:hypothetical protein
MRNWIMVVTIMMKAKRTTNKYKNSREHINGIVVIGSFRLFPGFIAELVMQG